MMGGQKASRTLYAHTVGEGEVVEKEDKDNIVVCAVRVQEEQASFLSHCHAALLFHRAMNRTR